MKNVKNTKAKTTKKSVKPKAAKKPNIVANPPKTVSPEEIVKDRIAAKLAAAKLAAKAKTLFKGKIKSTIRPEEDRREAIRGIKNHFMLDLGTNEDKFIDVLNGDYFCTPIPGEPARITSGRYHRSNGFKDYKKANEAVEEPKKTEAITLTVKAEDPTKLRGITITIA
jgi:hypothetical protein